VGTTWEFFASKTHLNTLAYKFKLLIINNKLVRSACTRINV